MLLTDTHTHLYYETNVDNQAQLMERCLANQINRLFLPNVDAKSIEMINNLVKSYPENCFAMAGLHPCDVKEDYMSQLLTIYDSIAGRKIYAIGEIGIDLYWDKTFIAEQEIAFKKQIDWALYYNYSIVIHCRNAFDEIFSILQTYPQLPKGIFHCFSGDIEQAQKILSLKNFKLGIGGVLTFKNSGLDKVVKNISLDDIVLETDSPYLAPIPHRGKRNESSYIPLIAQKIAEIKNITIQEVELITTKNAHFIFEK